MGMEMKRLRDGTLPNFLTPSDEAVEVCENVYNNKGGWQWCQPPLVLQMRKWFNATLFRATRLQLTMVNSMMLY